MEHYIALGFHVEPYPGSGYGFAQRDGVGIHFNAVPDLDLTSNNNAVYLYVSDPDALAAEWSEPASAVGPTCLWITSTTCVRALISTRTAT